MTKFRRPRLIIFVVPTEFRFTRTQTVTGNTTLSVSFALEQARDGDQDQATMAWHAMPRRGMAPFLSRT